MNTIQFLSLALTLFSVSCVLSQVNIQTGLVADIRLQGNAHEETGNLERGSIMGATPSKGRNAAPGTAFSFNGTSDNIRFAHREALNITEAISIACWIKYDAQADCFEDIVMKGNLYGFQFSCNGTGTIMFHLKSNGWHNLDSEFKPISGRWHHIAGTYDGKTQKIYIDGVLRNSETWEGNIETGDDPLDIGGKVADDNNWYKGSITELKIYNRALSASEIATLAPQNSFKTDIEIDCSGIANGQVLWCPFNETGADASNYGNHGKVYGAKSANDRFGRKNAIFCYNGIDNYISIPHSNSLDITEAITVMCWIKHDGNPRCFEDIVMKGNVYGLQFSCNGTGTVMFHLKIGGWYNLDSGIAPVPGQWHHIAGTYDGKTQSIYFDGALVKTENVSGKIESTTDPLDIAKQVAGDNNFFTGCIDDVLIYNRALSPAEIRCFSHETYELSDY